VVEFKIRPKKLGEGRESGRILSLPQSVITNDDRLTVLLNVTPFVFLVGIPEGDGLAVVAHEETRDEVLIAGSGGR
jgi:hypothetical protein